MRGWKEGGGDNVVWWFHQVYHLQLMQGICPLPSSSSPIHCNSQVFTPPSPSPPLLPRLHADSFHKPGFKLHARILHHLFSVVSPTIIKAPLWDIAAKGPTAYPSNEAFVREYVANLLASSFPNLTQQQVRGLWAKKGHAQGQRGVGKATGSSRVWRSCWHHCSHPDAAAGVWC